jgi:hypothetical protein
MQTLANQPDNFAPAMMVAVLVLAEMAAVISRLVVALRSTPIYNQNAFPRRLRRLGTRHAWAIVRSPTVDQDGQS